MPKRIFLPLSTLAFFAWFGILAAVASAQAGGNLGEELSTKTGALPQDNDKTLRQYLYYIKMKAVLPGWLAKPGNTLNDQDKISELECKIKADIDRDINRIYNMYGGKPARDYDALRSYLGWTKQEVKEKESGKDDSHPNVRLLLRGSDEVSQLGVIPIDDLSRASSAEFSLTRDLPSHQNDWQAKGSLLLTYRYAWTGNAKELERKKALVNDYSNLSQCEWAQSRAAEAKRAVQPNEEQKQGPKVDPSLVQGYVDFVLGASANRKVYASESKKDVDQLVFLFGAVSGQSGGNYLDGLIQRFFFNWSTDSSFISSTPALRYQWEPIFDLPGSGIPYWLLGGQLRFRWTALIDTWAGVTLDKGENQNLTKEEIFWRVGPRLSLDVWPFPIALNERLSLAANWTYLQGIEGGPSDLDYLDTSAAWMLDAKGHLSIKLGYQSGRLLESLQRIDTFTLGLGGKF